MHPNSERVLYLKGTSYSRPTCANKGLTFEHNDIKVSYGFDSLTGPRSIRVEDDARIQRAAKRPGEHPPESNGVGPWTKTSDLVASSEVRE